MSSAPPPDVRQAFAAESQLVTDTLAAVPGEAWERRALGQWTLRELVAHLFRAVTRVEAYLDQPVPHIGPDVTLADRVEYFRFDLAAEAPAVAERARKDAVDLVPERAAADFDQAWRTCHARIAALPADHVTVTLRGPMLLNEYLATRVLELVVHHMDVRAALDLPPQSDPGAARLTMALLEGLLGGPRPRNLGRTRFILAATGRVEADDPRLPVLC